MIELGWLAETRAVREAGLEAEEAEAFDLVVSTYGTSSKAPDAQLKRGMALAQLGKRQDACSVPRGASDQGTSRPVPAPRMSTGRSGSEDARRCPRNRWA